LRRFEEGGRQISHSKRNLKVGLGARRFEGDVEESLQSGIGIGSNVHDGTGRIGLDFHFVFVLSFCHFSDFFASKKINLYECCCNSFA
jgi:hypothetical protein